MPDQRVSAVSAGLCPMAEVTERVPLFRTIKACSERKFSVSERVLSVVEIQLCDNQEDDRVDCVVCLYQACTLLWNGAKTRT